MSTNDASSRFSGPDYDPHEALTECYDLWASGAWPDSNAVPNLEEVMGHLKNLLLGLAASAM